MCGILWYVGNKRSWPLAQLLGKKFIESFISKRRVLFLIGVIAIVLAYGGGMVNAQQAIVGSWEFIESTAGFTPNGPLWWWDSQIGIKSVDKGVTISWKTHAVFVVSFAFVWVLVSVSLLACHVIRTHE